METKKRNTSKEKKKNNKGFPYKHGGYNRDKVRKAKWDSLSKKEQLSEIKSFSEEELNNPSLPQLKRKEIARCKKCRKSFHKFKEPYCKQCLKGIKRSEEIQKSVQQK